MRKKSRTNARWLIGMMLATVLATVLATTSQAATYTWNGANVSGNWTVDGVGGNWSSGAAPVSDSANELVFADNLQGSTSTNNYAGNFLLKSMTFNSGLPPMTVGGGTLELTNSPAITVDSNNGVTINSNLRVAENLTLGGSGSGKLTLGGTVTLLETGTTNPITMNFTGDRNVELTGQLIGVHELGGTAQTGIISNNLSAGRTLTLSGPVAVKDKNTSNVRGMILSGTGDTVISGEIRTRPDGAANNTQLTISNTGVTTLTNTNTGLSILTLTGSGSLRISGTHPLGQLATLDTGSTKSVELLGNTSLGNFRVSGGTTFHVTGGFDLDIDGSLLGANLGGLDPTVLTLQFDNPLTTIAGDFGISSSGGTRTLNMTGSGRVEINGEIPSLSSTSHTLNFNINRTGTVALNNSNNFSDPVNNHVNLNIQSGTVELGANALLTGGSLGKSTNVNLGNTSGSANAALVLAGAFEMGRAVVVKSGSSGSATLGGITADSSSFTNSITLNKSVNLTAATGGEVLFSGNLGGAGGVTLLGDGLVKLAGTNTYGGATSVASGTLLVNGSLTSGVTVQAGAVLGGTGAINGASTVYGTLSPGESPGLLNFGASLTLENDATTLMEIGLPTTRGVTYDAVDVTTMFTYGGDLTLDITAPDLSGEWDLFNFASQSGDFDSVAFSGNYIGTLMQSGSTWSGQVQNVLWTFNQNSGILSGTLIPAPEPSSLALLGLGILFLRRRRKTSQA